ncbi:hypothetical protein QL285_078726 [Trifolium repens]|jgi:hypothetical protein|nr:hypothetical protein QL285_078726 [Trifolium repens]
MSFHRFAPSSQTGSVAGKHCPRGDNESLRQYIKRFNKEAAQVHTSDGMKKYLIERYLRRHSDFAKAIGIERQATLMDLLRKATTFIEYEEKETSAIHGQKAHRDTTVVPPEEEETKDKMTDHGIKIEVPLASLPTTLRSLLLASTY